MRFDVQIRGGGCVILMYEIASMNKRRITKFFDLLGVQKN